MLHSILSTPLAMEPAAAAALRADIERAGGDPRALAGGPGRPLGAATSVRVRDAVAIHGLTGTISPRTSVLQMLFGGTSLEDFGQGLETATADPTIRANLIVVDSPGGQAAGVHEAAEAVARAGRAKPTWAYVTGQACSAAYWIAAAAGRVECSPTALVGSIGAILTLVDTSGLDARLGIVRHEFVSSQSPLKGFRPEDEGHRAAMQATADGLAAVFVADVARYRGVGEDVVLARYGGGAVLVGAAAVAAGLADATSSPEDTLARLAAARAGGSASATAAHHVPETTMRHVGHAASAAPADPEAAARAAWATRPDLRAEFGSVEALVAYEVRAVPRGHPSAVGAAPSAVAPRGRAGAGFSEAATEAEFRADPALRAEFREVGSYVAFRRAEACGLVRMRGATR